MYGHREGNTVRPLSSLETALKIHEKGTHTPETIKGLKKNETSEIVFVSKLGFSAFGNELATCSQKGCKENGAIQSVLFVKL